MKNCIKTAFAAILVFTTFTSYAQNSYYQGKISVVQKAFVQRGDSVYVDMDISLSGVSVPSRSVIVLTPVISSGSMAKQLQPLLVNGKNKNKTYERSVVLNNNVHPAYASVYASKNKTKIYPYHTVIAYEKWMADAKFVLEQDRMDCCNPPHRLSVELLAAKLGASSVPAGNPELQVAVYEPIFAASYITPEVEAVKSRSDAGKAYLDFPRGQTAIRSDYRNNAAELEKIHKLILELKNDPDATITGISLDGFASPEGTYTANMTLSGGRAVALKNQIRSIYGFPEIMFTVRGMGENWNGLDTLVEKSHIADKYQILAIIRGVGIFDGRETKLMNLSSGVPYRTMAAEFFPQLRYCLYEIRYTVKPFTVEKGKQIIHRDPARLSLNEMFLIAQSYPKGSSEFNEVFEIAARVFPQNDTSNLNAAATALNQKDVQRAANYLGRVKTMNASYFNNMGILNSLQGNNERAIEYFNRAKAAGNYEAVGNLFQISKTISKIP